MSRIQLMFYGRKTFLLVTVIITCMAVILLLLLPAKLVAVIDSNYTVLADQPPTRSEILSEKRGEILDVMIRDGDFVEDGQVLAYMDFSNGSITVEEASRALDVARKEMVEAEAHLESLLVTSETMIMGGSPSPIPPTDSSPSIREEARPLRELSDSAIALVKARSSLVRTRAQLERVETLYREGVLSQRAVDNARSLMELEERKVLELERQGLLQQEVHRREGVGTVVTTTPLLSVEMRRDSEEGRVVISRRASTGEIQIARERVRELRDKYRRAEAHLTDVFQRQEMSTIRSRSYGVVRILPWVTKGNIVSADSVLFVIEGDGIKSLSFNLKERWQYSPLVGSIATVTVGDSTYQGHTDFSLDTMNIVISVFRKKASDRTMDSHLRNDKVRAEILLAEGRLLSLLWLWLYHKQGNRIVFTPDRMH